VRAHRRRAAETKNKTHHLPHSEYICGTLLAATLHAIYIYVATRPLAAAPAPCWPLAVGALRPPFGVVVLCWAPWALATANTPAASYFLLLYTIVLCLNCLFGFELFV
jgi:hypothetical protein